MTGRPRRVDARPRRARGTGGSGTGGGIGTLGIVLGALIVGSGLVGCGAEPDAHPADQNSTQNATLPESATETPGPSPVQLPWPAPTAADAAALQAAVDRGAQPWVLDPSEVALSYAETAHGWSDVEALPGPDGTDVDLRNARGERLTVRLAQPGRTGDHGIWVVVAEQ